MQYPDKLLLEDGVVTALAHYVVQGLSPGSFGEALLISDINRAYRCAHALLKQKRQGQLVLDNMMYFASSFVPVEARDSEVAFAKWTSHDGLRYADMPVKLSIRMRYGRKPWFMNMFSEQAIDHIWNL